jgi:thiol-disulfide isomerase/thioredoxin
MQKLLNNLANINFFICVILIYFGEVKIATIFSALFAFTSSFYIFDDESPLKQAYKHYGFFLLFIVIGFFQWGLVLIGPTVFIASYLGYKLRKSALLKKIYSGLIVLAIAILSTIYVQPLLAKKQLHNTVNKELNLFKYYDLNEQREIKSDELKGKIVVLNFWATWCPTCVKELKPYSRAADYFANNNSVKFIAINVGGGGDTEEKVRFFLNKKEYAFRAGIDIDASQEFNVEALPSIVIIDKEGKLRVSHSGYSPAENLEEYLIEEVKKLL